MTDTVLLVIPNASYKTEDFMRAADCLGVEVVVGTESKQALEDLSPGHTLALDLADPGRSIGTILDLDNRTSLGAVIGTDDETTVLAAMAAEALALPHNPVDAVRSSRDKHATRASLAAAGLRGPAFKAVPLTEPPGDAAESVSYPCVLKPLFLSASRGVLRANGPDGFVDAFERIRSILADPELAGRAGDGDHILVEEYLPGQEVALEGLLQTGQLRLLALFDKPDPLEGPTFEETLYVTPSRHPQRLQEDIALETAAACRALGLRDGPVHAELRLHDGKPWILEVASRTIGGLCSRSLRFGTGMSLEEIVLRHALGRDCANLHREALAAGVLMLPVPRAGVLQRVDGQDAARALPGIEAVTLTIPLGSQVLPLPEGHRYLGFVFARGDTPATVEAALRQAQATLSVTIEPA